MPFVPNSIPVAMSFRSNPAAQGAAEVTVGKTCQCTAFTQAPHYKKEETVKRSLMVKSLTIKGTTTTIQSERAVSPILTASAEQLRAPMSKAVAVSCWLCDSV